MEDITFGWLRDQPDLRDFTIDLPKEGDGFATLQTPYRETPITAGDELADALRKLDFGAPPAKHLDNLEHCSPVQNQLNLGSCTAQAGVGLLEYYERRSYGTHIDASPLFLYKTTRNLLGWTGDTGAYCRTTMAALALFGAPPESYWPYSVPDFDVEPDAFRYAFAQSYQGLVYHRVDQPQRGLPLMTRIKMMIAAGWPMMFGFSVYQSYTQGHATGEIPYPAPGERRVGGHAVIAVGYDDAKEIKNARPGERKTKGAILFKNSWGPRWGCTPPGHDEGGYGWLPYKYVEEEQAVDWWTLTKAEWLSTGKFGMAV
jgi:C1A family cysteine protease